MILVIGVYPQPVLDQTSGFVNGFIKELFFAPLK
jgi:hypothetical protein